MSAVLTAGLLLTGAVAGETFAHGVVYTRRFNEDRVAIFHPATGQTLLGKVKERDGQSGWIYTYKGTSFYKANKDGSGGSLYKGGGQAAWMIQDRDFPATGNRTTEKKARPSWSADR
jgi:hypothetical protein